LLNAWGVALEPTGGSPREALALYRQALKLKPDYWNAWTNVQSASINLGDEEGAWQAAVQMQKIAGGRPGRAPEQDYQSFDLLTWNLQALLNGRIADAEAYGGTGSMIGSAGTSLADIHARLHDLEAAEHALQTSKEPSNDPAVAAMTHFVRARLATEAGDTARAVGEMAALGAAYANPELAAEVAGYSCWIAAAEEAAGHRDTADAILASAGTFVDCYRFRADTLDGRGDWTGAQKAYLAAVRLAPDLPAAYYSWGLALARHGDLAGAAEKLKQAHNRGPHWADPLKAWGDVLIRQGQFKHGMAKYTEALAYAPHWAELKKALDGTSPTSSTLAAPAR
jgi:tetratricopeptide (TPR) repeat protein